MRLGTDRIEIDGPYSLFESVTKYGLQLAMVLPALEESGVRLVKPDHERRPVMRLAQPRRHDSQHPGMPSIPRHNDRRMLRQKILLHQRNGRFMDRFFDNYLQGPMQQIVGDRIRSANADMSNERTTLQTAYRMINRQVMSKTWVAGAEFSMADCAAAPALFYASTVQPFPGELSHLGAYFDRLTQRPSIQRVLDEAKPYFSLYPFADCIPKRFL